MLTKEDLQALSVMMDQKLEPVHTEIKGIQTEIKGMQTEIKNIHTEIKGIHTEIEGIHTEIEGMQTEIRGMQTEIKGMQQRITAIELNIENEVGRNINLLVETFLPAAKKYEMEVEKIEVMQTEINVVKGVVKEHSKILQNIS